MQWEVDEFYFTVHKKQQQQILRKVCYFLYFLSFIITCMLLLLFLVALQFSMDFLAHALAMNDVLKVIYYFSFGRLKFKKELNVVRCNKVRFSFFVKQI